MCDGKNDDRQEIVSTNLFGETTREVKISKIFSDDEIIKQAIKDFKLRGYIFKDLTLFECMTDLNSLATKKDKECTFTNLGYSVADTYHKHRFFSSAINMKSPYETFHFDKNIEKVLRMSLKNESKLTHRLYSFFYMVNGTQQCANFRPGIAKILYNKYCNNNSKVLDTSTGYGGRLIGFLASIASEYVGIDPNTDTYRANEKIKIDLGRHKKVKLYNCPAEKWDNSYYKEYFDFAFTSPPYFKKEIYSDEETNSCNAYPEYKEWIKGFLHPMILKTYESLKYECFYLLNIEDVKINSKLYSLVKDSIDFALSIGFEHVNNESLAFRNSDKVCIENVDSETIIVLKKRKRGNF